MSQIAGGLSCLAGSIIKAKRMERDLASLRGQSTELKAELAKTAEEKAKALEVGHLAMERTKEAERKVEGLRKALEVSEVEALKAWKRADELNLVLRRVEREAAAQKEADLLALEEAKRDSLSLGDVSASYDFAFPDASRLFLADNPRADLSWTRATLVKHFASNPPPRRMSFDFGPLGEVEDFLPGYGLVEEEDEDEVQEIDLLGGAEVIGHATEEEADSSGQVPVPEVASLGQRADL